MSGASFPARRFSRQSRFEEKNCGSRAHPKTRFLACQKSGAPSGSWEPEGVWRSSFVEVRLRLARRSSNEQRKWSYIAAKRVGSVGRGSISELPTIRTWLPLITLR
jgi:hypothetical protein